MKKIYLVTGANGHLGSTVIRLLKKRNEEIRGFILPEIEREDQEKLHYIKGDVTKLDTLRPLFMGLEGYEIIVIHTAGIVDISDHISRRLYEVNVNGTRNVLKLCREYKVKRLVYVSSVHAIPERKDKTVITETKTFSKDLVKGGYAKTKAKATELVLEASQKGLDAVVVHPSGILGPYDDSGNHLVQLIKEYLEGKLPACVKGGYDFVDVRDVAKGCLLAAEKGRAGECYILSNQYYEIRYILDLVRRYAGGKRLPVLPVEIARAAVPFIQWYARKKGRRPLYTAYSLQVIGSFEHFSHEKATRELGYKPGKIEDTIKDTIKWYRKTRNSDSINLVKYTVEKKLHLGKRNRKREKFKNFTPGDFAHTPSQ